MVFRNQRFLSALGFTALQQFLLALSTYCIAQAGSALSHGDIHRVLLQISLFFIYALLAYATSSMATLLNTRAANEIWKNYSTHLLCISTKSLEYASDRNQKSTAQRLAGEAQSTIAHACDFYLDMVSVSLNILFTLAVVYIAVG